jgi:hypothetical protein
MDPMNDDDKPLDERLDISTRTSVLDPSEVDLPYFDPKVEAKLRMKIDLYICPVSLAVQVALYVGNCLGTSTDTHHPTNETDCHDTISLVLVSSPDYQFGRILCSSRRSLLSRLSLQSIKTFLHQY